ncbi:hypothetical protein ADEAN_000119600 [Angomonas deanei]|uniref:ABC transporter n=1 Tax=Angomonas deanei TaxID=59799 RepID=A0A7G2C4U9_9TRYP|nr:hypothetical protein ADEAN_000119600 [Angomonas deanei]
MDPVARRGLWDTISIIADYCAVMLTTHHLEEVEALADRVAIMAGGRLRCIGSLAHIKEVYGCGYEICLNVDTRKLRKKQLAAEQRRIERASRSMMTPQAHEPMDDVVELQTIPTFVSLGEAPKTTRIRFSAGDDGDAVDMHPSVNDDDEEEEMDENDEPIMRFMEKHLPAAQLREKFRQERYVFSMQPPAGKAPKGKGSSSLRETDKVTQQNFLPRVFELLLTHQEEYCISHFSVSQASIEQVFLRFCDEDENEGNNNYLEEEEAAVQETESESSLPSEEEIELESHEPDSLYASHVPSHQEMRRLPHRERPQPSVNTPPVQPFKPLGKSHNRQLFLLDGEEEVDLSYRRHAGRHPAVDQSDSWAELQMSSNVFPPPPHSHVHSDAAEQYDIQYSNYEDVVPPEHSNAFVRVDTSDSQAKVSKKSKTSSSEDHQYEAQFSSKSY